MAVLGEGTLGEFRATMSLGVVLLELSPLPPLIRYCRKLFWPEKIQGKCLMEVCNFNRHADAFS